MNLVLFIFVLSRYLSVAFIDVSLRSEGQLIRLINLKNTQCNIIVCVKLKVGKTK